MRRTGQTIAMARSVAFLYVVGVAAAVTLALPGLAGAYTLGFMTPPLGSTGVSCGTGVYGQDSSDPSSPFAVPGQISQSQTYGGQITRWQTYTTPGDTPGSQLTLVVLRPVGAPAAIVVATDTETLPNPLPEDHVVSFTPPSPINVNVGDYLALYESVSGQTCEWANGSIQYDDDASFFNSAPIPGQLLMEPSAQLFTAVDVAATFLPPEDAGVSTTAGPPRVAAGRPAVLVSTVSNGGPDSGPITFVDHVPNGLSISSTSAHDATCSTRGETVTCTISGLRAGQTASEAVTVVSRSPGSYVNRVSVADTQGNPDPNTADNNASATLVAGPPRPTSRCVVPKLKGTPLKVAKTVLKDLGSRVKTTRAHSKSVHSGSVVKTNPGAGRYARHKTITLIISIGPKKNTG
jgi:Domain of unknown function DUF11/PASTA domain